MGLSLRNLTNKIGNVVSGVERQINPFDNGATYSNPAPQGPKPPSFVQQAANAPVLGSILRTDQRIINPVNQGINDIQHPSQLYNPLINSVNNSILGSGIRLGAANVTDNPTARLNAKVALAQSFNKAAENAKNAAASGAIGEGGIEEPNIPKPKITLNGKDISPTPPKVAGKATSGEPPDFLKTSPGYKPKSEAEVGQVPTTNMTSLDTPAANTAKNPHQADIPVVKPNDYGQVISNEQSASKPVSLAGTVWQQDMKNLAKANPDEAKNFWRYFQDPGYADAPKSPELQRALGSWRAVDDRIHGNSQALGGNTNYLENHGLHPAQFDDELTQHLVNGGNPDTFSGLNNVSRKHATIADLEAAAEQHGFKVGTDPISEGTNYIAASANALRRRAIIKGLGEADGHNMEKPETLVLGGDHNVPLSKAGARAVRGLQKSNASDNPLIQGARTANVGAKSTLLSFGQFHPNNISLARAAPTLAMPKPTTAFYRNAEGKWKFDPTMSSHSVRAAKGLYATYRPLFPGGKNFVNNLKARAVADGMDIKAAKIGAPYNAEFLDNEGSKIAGVGHNLLGRQMLGMHDQAVRAVVGDLEKRGISLDSPEARVAGKALNNLMGFVNDEAQKIPPGVSRKMGDWLLARQFTHSKFSQARTAIGGGRERIKEPGLGGGGDDGGGSSFGKRGVGGAYARANVAANVAASAAIIGAIGYLFHQKSDNIKDLFIRALVDPAAPTNLKDSKGNTVKLRTPGTDTSDIAKLLGFKAVRNSDGHLGINWNPSNLPSGVEDYLRARLSPGGSMPVKLATNQNYAGKPLYDPTAKLGTKAEQAGTVLGTGLLPIGAQGLPMVNGVEKHLPGNVQDVINANKPGSNPLVKSIGSSFGLTPSTDQTVGKGKDTAAYYASAKEAVDQAKNVSEKTALQNYYGSKKNPVTGKYNVNPNPNDSARKAKDLLDAPRTIDIIRNANQKLQSSGSKIDPLWKHPIDQITSVLQYQSMPYGGPDRVHWYNQNKDWYQPLSDERSAFFNSLPKGDPNKPQQPIEYPAPSAALNAKLNTLKGIKDPAKYSQYIQDNPDVQDQFDKAAEYDNKMRVATLGKGSELDTYPTASPEVKKLMDTYNALPTHDGPKGGSKTRSLWIQAHPADFKSLTQAWTERSLYGLEKSASQAEFKDTGFDQKGLKDITSVAKDIGTTTDSNGNAFYALGGSSSSGSGSSSGYSKSSKSYTKYSSKSSSSSSGSGSHYVSRSAAKLGNPTSSSVDIDAGGKRGVAKLKKGPPKKSSVKLAQLSPKRSIAIKGKPTVSVKKSLV
jgi:hypothetical protein